MVELTGTVKGVEVDDGAPVATVAVTAKVAGKTVLGRVTARVRLPA
jgi:hypothetical protein